MTVTLSLVLILGIAVVALLRFRAVAIGAAIVCVLFGFYVADTDAAATINDTVSSIADVISDIG
jgi:hypothetical protein